MDEDMKIEEIEQKLKDVRSITERFKKNLGRIESLKDEIKLSDTKNKKYVVELKKSLKKLLEYRYNNCNNKEEATSFLEELYFYIDVLDDKTIYEYLHLFDKITFNNIQEERNILENIDLPFYINKINGDIAILKNNNKNVIIYSSIRDEEITLDKDNFKNNYLSLKDFIDKGMYVGNRRVWLKNSDGENLEINLPYQEFIYYYDGVMLAFEHNLEGKDNFYFYPASVLEIATNLEWSFSDKKDKPEIVAGLFKNKEYTYQSVVDKLKKRLRVAEEKSKSK